MACEQADEERDAEPERIEGRGVSGRRRSATVSGVVVVMEATS